MAFFDLLQCFYMPPALFLPHKYLNVLYQFWLHTTVTFSCYVGPSAKSACVSVVSLSCDVTKLQHTSLSFLIRVFRSGTDLEVLSRLPVGT